MAKTVAYYIEMYCGPVVGASIGLAAYNNWNTFSFIGDVSFFDKLITISTTLFGFLLTVLTLIIQSSSPLVIKMKKYGSYKRLITYNKAIVILCVVICLFSLVLNCTRNILNDHGFVYLALPSAINFALFLWSLINTIIFVLIFYRILILDADSN